jgi:two-component system OmpR family response regulator/two-component system response regulator RstA
MVRTTFSGPILILTARGEEVDEVVGLEVGADDYLSKPVRPRVLLARLRAQLRKSTFTDGATERDEISLGDLRIDASRRIVELRSLTVETTTAEFDVLWLLAQHAGKVLSRREMFEQLHGFPYDGLDRSIDLRVSRLRRKLGDDSEKPRLIKSVRGVGYLLSSES